ncbi:MAG TPA: hypothetical protein VHE30_11605 [Polyangiaceae bacterium]|nr:hypothetical protein [Polyangiaceae bacterium]
MTSVRLLSIALVALASCACSNTDGSPNQTPVGAADAEAGGHSNTDSGSSASGTDAEAGGAPAYVEVPAKDPYTKACSTARWGKVSDACWSCLCGACAGQLNACDTDCMGIFVCAEKNQTLVNVGADIQCEIRATAVSCLTTPEAQAATQALLNLDGCLIAHGSAPERFRACEAECQVPYPGDVCERFPAQ